MGSETAAHSDTLEDMGRRAFGSVMLGAGVAATAGTAGAMTTVTESEVTIKTADGTCDAVFIHPKGGKHPGVLIWTDAFGLRPAFRQMGARLAAEGYSVLIPNPYYRTTKAPGISTDINFDNPDDRAKVMALIGSLSTGGAAERDAASYIGFLDTQSTVNTSKKIGTTGYCMGGPLTMRTAATVSDRVGAAGSFHGGSLVTDKPDSPHLLVPKIKARYMFAIAQNDDEKEPETKNVLKSSFAAAKNPADIEVFKAAHGWCMADLKMYDAAEAERVWTKLLAHFKKHLA